MTALLAVALPGGIAGVAIVAVIAYFGVRMLGKKDSNIEERRERAFELNEDLQKVGIDFLSPVLKSYSVGDYGGVMRGVKELSSGLRDENRRDAAVTQVAKQHVLKLLDDPERADSVLTWAAQAALKRPELLDRLQKKVKELKDVQGIPSP